MNKISLKSLKKLTNKKEFEEIKRKSNKPPKLYGTGK